MARFATILAALFFVGASVSGVAAEPRTVLVEEFSNTSCPYCPAASAVIDGLSDQYPIDMITITYHTWWPSSSDPYYQANISENTSRINMYGVNATPTVVVDGQMSSGSGGAWESEVLDRATSDSPLRIDMSADIGASEISAEITNTSGGTVTGLVHFVLIENGLVWGGHPHNHTMRDFLPGVAGVPISLNASESVIETRTFVIDPSWVEEDLECVAFVQKNDGSREIIQAARVFFPLDEPELALAERVFDDSVGGDGNGRSDPGESVELSFEIANLGLEDAFGVSGTLSSGDPFVTIDDGSGTWGDVGAGDRVDNAADPFMITIDADTPWGHEITLTIDVTTTSPYAKQLDFVVGVGSPYHPIGADAYGYFAYEDQDPYDVSPAFDWVEIDPNLGGNGTLISLGDDQTTSRTLPFDFKLYGQVDNRLSICSNGWVALGLTGSIDNANGDIPGSAGPPNMIAAFWTDLNPVAAGGGKMYEYADVANGRYIVEFSGVEHYHSSGLGTPETFQIILNDPAVHPTQTGDGEVVFNYLTLTQPGSCTAGIENASETVGTEYTANGHVNAAAYGLADGRAVKFTTTPPTGLVATGEGGVTAPILGLSFRPNPFRAGATIRYATPVSGAVRLQIFRPDGSLVRTLLDGEALAPTGVVTWDGTDARGIDVPDGVYFYRMSGEGFARSGKVVRLR